MTGTAPPCAVPPEEESPFELLPDLLLDPPPYAPEETVAPPCDGTLPDESNFPLPFGGISAAGVGGNVGTVLTPIEAMAPT